MSNLDIICDSPLILNSDIENESNIMNPILYFSFIKFLKIMNENYKMYKTYMES